MSTAPRRLAIASASAAVVAVAASGCAPLPQSPPPLPATFVPEVALPTPAPQVPVGSDGFTIVERVAMRVSVVTCEGYSNGSAWVLDQDTVVTNAHVVEGAMELELTSYDGHHYRGVATAADDAADLAVIDILGEFPETASIAPDAPRAAEELYIVGYPEAGRLTTTDATYYGEVPEELGLFPDDVYSLAALTFAGNSGSPVTDVDGAVVGVLYASDEAGSSLAVTHESLTAFLDSEPVPQPLVESC